MMSSFIHIIFWLCFLLVHQLEASSINFKSCPSTQPSECPSELYKECNRDQDCDTRYPELKGMQKCCNQCGRSCVTHVVTNAPREPQNVKIVTKLVAKCPTKPPSSEFPPGPDHECQNDASCDTKYPGQGLKCCQDGCEFRCIPPVVESVIQPFVRPGYCPEPFRRRYKECYGEETDECEGDENCEQLHPGLGLKCCQSGCHKACLAPVETSQGSVVPGFCPVFPTAAECPPEPDHECDSDLKCSELHPGLGLKCCIDGCDYRCTPPILG